MFVQVWLVIVRTIAFSVWPRVALVLSLLSIPESIMAICSADALPLPVPASRAEGGNAVLVDVPLPLAVPGSRAADGEGRIHRNKKDAVWNNWYTKFCLQGCILFMTC